MSKTTSAKSDAKVGLIDMATLRQKLSGDGEFAFVDTREQGLFGEGHPFLAINIPYSRLEIDFPRLVPRPDTSVVLLSEDVVGQSAVEHLQAVGYTDVVTLNGGLDAWRAAGEPVFASVDVPSKALAECIEHAYRTPDIEAAELGRLLAENADVVVLDNRTVEEFESFRLPGAINVPGAELVYRFSQVIRSADTLVVVTCAGRTRGIFGAQALINAGVPNKVVALSGGTQGWRLAGHDLDRTAPRLRFDDSLGSTALELAKRRGEAMGLQFAIRTIDRRTLAMWRDDPGRTTYIIDVRMPKEYAAGHLDGAVSIPGGQLLSTLDKWVGTRGARLVLVDDDGVRATVTAHWLIELGWDVAVLPGLTAGEAPAAAHAALTPEVQRPDLTAQEAVKWLNDGAALISADPSGEYRKAHPKGAIWVNRSRLEQLPQTIKDAARIVITGENGNALRLVARDLAADGREVGVFVGNEDIWQAAGLDVVSTPDQPTDPERIDYLFWLHDRHAGNLVSSRAYLDWELGLPSAVQATGHNGLRVRVWTNA